MISDIESRCATDMASTVQVLMSTYNGTDYLREQIDSILAQDHPHVRLLVRDDGSSDGTVSVLRQYENSHGNVKVVTGENLGVVDSFFRLLELADDVDYYAFSDQDDVWKSNKLSRAVARLEAEEEEGEPLLYFNRQEFVDADLDHLGYSPEPNVLGFENALIQNQPLGCATVINTSARELLVQNLPDEALMHDWWVYAVVSAFGRVFYDPTPTLLYRQHGENVVGDTENRFKHFMRRLQRFLTRNWKNDIFRPSNQAEKIDRIFGEHLEDQKKTLVKRMVWSKRRFVNRLIYALSTGVRRNTLVDDFLFRFMVLINRY